MGQFDDNSSAFYLFNCSMRWVAIRLDSLTGERERERGGEEEEEGGGVVRLITGRYPPRAPP